VGAIFLNKGGKKTKVREPEILGADFRQDDDIFRSPHTEGSLRAAKIWRSRTREFMGGWPQGTGDVRTGSSGPTRDYFNGRPFPNEQRGRGSRVPERKGGRRFPKDPDVALGDYEGWGPKKRVGRSLQIGKILGSRLEKTKKAGRFHRCAEQQSYLWGVLA